MWHRAIVDAKRTRKKARSREKNNPSHHCRQMMATSTQSRLFESILSRIWKVHLNLSTTISKTTKKHIKLSLRFFVCLFVCLCFEVAHSSLPSSSLHRLHDGQQQADAIPPLFQDLSQRAMKLASSVSNAFPLPFHACRVNGRLYPVGSELGRHVDNHDGWVVLFSLGCDCKFYIKAGEQPEKSMKLMILQLLLFRWLVDWFLTIDELPWCGDWMK